MPAFERENVRPSTDPSSPFFINVPGPGSKPIDNLVSYFKYYKMFIKALSFYLKEIVIVKDFEANLNSQLVNSVQFPGFKDLPVKLMSLKDAQSPTSSQSTTPVKELKRTLSSNSLNSNINGSTSGEKQRPALFKTKSNNSFLKHASTTSTVGTNNSFNSHKRNISMSSANPKQPSALSSPPIGSTPDVHVPPNFFPSDSVFNKFAPLLINHHFQTYIQQLKLHKEITTKLLPRVETLLKNLSLKIKEIKSSLKNESFANPEMVREVSKTGQIIARFANSVERYSAKEPLLKKQILEEEGDDKGALDDPFLLKLQVDYQVKRQLIKENYLFASYVNLQNISKDLFTYVLKELNYTTDKFGKLLNHEGIQSENNQMVTFHSMLRETVSSSSGSDWEFFISHNPSLLNTYKDTEVSPKRTTRNFKDVRIPYEDSVHTKCIRFGTMYRKSKLLKNYSGCYYVLTSNYLHEFKLDGEFLLHNAKKKEKDKIGGFIGHDDIPVKSYNLNSYALKVKDEKGFKFFLIKTSGSIEKYTFKCLNAEDYTSWYSDLSELLKYGSDHYARYSFIEEKIKLRDADSAGTFSSSQEVKSDDGINGLKSMESDSKSSTNNEMTLPREGDNDQSLSGMFTPKIQTPVHEQPLDEGGNNPFDKEFVESIPQKVPSAQSSPSESPAGGSHKEEHEMYLNIQKEFLKQQQEILNLKAKERELESKNKEQQREQEIMSLKLKKTMLTDNTQQLPSAKSSPTLETTNFISQLSRSSSGESLNSDRPHTSNVQKIVNSGQALYDGTYQRGTPTFTINDYGVDLADEKVPSDSNSSNSSQRQSEIPKVLISSE